MNDKITIRKATEKDIPFLREAIKEAEKSGTDKISYCTLFSITEEKLDEIIYQVLMEDIEGQELCVSHFLIAEVENENAGACAAWIEGLDGSPSSIIKANILFYFLGDKICNRAAANLKLMEDININREKNAIQIESVYVKEKYRGMGIANQIIGEHVKFLATKNNTINKVQIILAKTNDKAYKAYQKFGFKTIIEKCSDKPEILNLLPSNCRIMMEMNTNELK
jgi:ribosomal protein S18 acetylase RimI-like enzyme